MSTIAPAASLMARDMAEQPDVVRRLAARRDEVRARLLTRVLAEPRGIALVGRGSSSNAAMYGGTLLETVTGIAVTLVPPSLGRLYGVHTRVDGFLAIGLSQSGRTAEVVASLDRLRRDGALTVAITADASSPLAGAADVVLDVETGRERAVPATKTFTAQVAMLALIAQSLGGVPWDASDWHTAVIAMQRALDDPSPVHARAARLAGARHVSVIGSGLGVALAYETALKIMEASLIPASAFSCESFRHGPIAIAGARHPVVGVALGDASRDEVARIRARLGGVPVVVIGGDVPVPGDELPEALSILPAAVRAQQLAIELAERRHLDPDHPPRIRKVTL